MLVHNQPLFHRGNEIVSGNRRFEVVKRLGWKPVECDQIKVDPDATALHLVHFNKQRIKTCRELINEIKILLPLYSKERGARTDLTSVPENKGFNARDMVSEQVGLSSSQIGKLLLK